MSRTREAVREALNQASREHARRMGLAPERGITTLYKFKGFRGAQREHVQDMLARGRVYFSSPDEFNDPYDVAPVIALGGNPNDPNFLQELEARENAKLKAIGQTDEQIRRYREANGVAVDRLAAEARDDIRQKLLRTTRIFCLSAERCHPLQWSHYGDQHRGVCFHFRCGVGNVIGLARKVEYRRERAPILIPLDRQSTDEIMRKLVLVKADFWSYEQEFRVIADTESDWGGELEESFLQLQQEDLIGLTIGMRMPNLDRTTLLEMLDRYRPELPVWECVEDHERFWMNCNRVR
jgi:hypothetical protein